MKKAKIYREKLRVARLMNVVTVSGHTAISWAAAYGKDLPSYSCYAPVRSVAPYSRTIRILIWMHMIRLEDIIILQMIGLDFLNIHIKTKRIL